MNRKQSDELTELEGRVVDAATRKEDLYKTALNLRGHLIALLNENRNLFPTSDPVKLDRLIANAKTIKHLQIAVEAADNAFLEASNAWQALFHVLNRKELEYSKGDREFINSMTADEYFEHITKGGLK